MIDHKTENFLMNKEVNGNLESILTRKVFSNGYIFYGPEGIKFLEKVNEGFKLIAKEKNWTVISAAQDINTISNEIKETLLKKFLK